jgi:hypothetical protein
MRFNSYFTILVTLFYFAINFLFYSVNYYCVNSFSFEKRHHSSYSSKV